MKILILDKFSYQSFPIVDGMVDIEDSILNEIGKTKCFDVENQCVIDYEAPKEKVDYDALVNQKIRARYSESQEFAILRQRDRKTAEFQEYDSYCEQCKKEAKKECDNEIK